MTQNTPKRLLIKNGKVVLENEVVEKDIFIENGVIKLLAKNLQYCGVPIIDAKCKFVIPGGIDPHTHFSQPKMGTTTIDDFYSGTKAALAGGTTTIIDFIKPEGGECLKVLYDKRREEADKDVVCDYGFHVAFNKFDPFNTPKEMCTFRSCLGVNSFMFFMGGRHSLNDYELYSAFEECVKMGVLPMVHAENHYLLRKNEEKQLINGEFSISGFVNSRPPEVEAEAIYRACVVANQVKCPLYLANVMSAEGLTEIQRCREKFDLNIMAEIIPASFCFDRSVYNKPYDEAAQAVCCPPFGGPESPKALVEALPKDISKITASAHTAFCKCQKDKGKAGFVKIPTGINGVEERMAVVWEKCVEPGILDICQFAEVTSTHAAKIFNLYPKKGVIKEGSDADLVIWDTQNIRKITAKKHHGASDMNLFEGVQVRASAEYVIIRGRICIEKGEILACRGFGKFIQMQPFSPFIYKNVPNKGLLTSVEEEKFKNALQKAEDDIRKTNHELGNVHNPSSGDKFEGKKCECYKNCP